MVSGASWRRGSTLISSVIILTAPARIAARETQALSLPTAEAVFNVPGDEFSGISSVRELSDGRLIVADQSENRIRLIDWGSLSSVPISRTGDGPGEYRSVGWLYPLGGDSTLLTDRTSRRWYVLVGPEIVHTLPASGPLPGLLGPLLRGSDDGGHVLGTRGQVYSTNLPPSHINADTLVLLLGHLATATVDPIGHVAGRGRFGLCMAVRAGRGGQTRCNPVATEDLALLFPDGWVAVARTHPYRADWRDPRGNWTFGPPLPFSPVELDQQEKCAALGMINGVSLPDPCDPDGYSEWPKTAPPFFHTALKGMAAPNSPTLFATPAGELLIRRAPSTTSPESRYDLVDRHADLVGTLTIPFEEAIVGFGTRSVYIVGTDEFGLQILRRHPWPEAW